MRRIRARPAVAALRPTAAVLASVPEASRLLTPMERDRAGAFREDSDRSDFIAAHLLVRLCLADHLGGSPADYVVEQTCDRCGGDHGRPHVVGLPGVHVSWSHAAGAVGAVVAGAPCGIDVEPHIDVETQDGQADHALMALSLTAAEQRGVQSAGDRRAAFLRHWLRKEALVKAAGYSLEEVFELDVTDARDGVLRLPRHGGTRARIWSIDEVESATHAATVITTERTDVAWTVELPS